MGKSDDENVAQHDGQSSVYYDATEHSQLLDRHHSASGVGAIPEGMPTESPWRASDGPISPKGTLPSLAHGYLTYGFGMSSVPLSETETTTLRDDDSTTASAWEGSYLGHVRAQSALPKKWLSEVDIEPYMRLPGRPGRRENIFAGGGRRTDLREPLLEELLPTSRKATLFPALQGPVEKRDRVVAIVFWTLFALMMVMGLVLCMVYPSELRDRFVRSRSVFRAIADSSWLLFASVVVGGLISLVWVLLMRWFPSEIVHAMVYFAPTAALIVGLGATAEFLHSDPGSGVWLLLVAIAGLATSAIFAMFALSNRQHVKHTVDIIRMTAEVLTSNPSIYLSSLLLLIGYVAFIALWLVFYLHALMIGHVESPPDVVGKVWRLNGLSYYIQAFLIFMLIWTSLVLSGVQKCMIGGVVGRWYFFRSDPVELTSAVVTSSSAWKSMHAAFTTFFGQICLASLILAWVRVARGFFQCYNYITSKISHEITSSMLKSVTLFIGFVERVCEHLSDLALYLVSMTGESFWTSSRSVFKVFRRNMLLSFAADTLAQLLMTISTAAAAGLAGLISFIFIAHGLQSPYGWVGATLFSLLTWYVLRYFTGIFSDTMDACFVCFAIDLDTEKLHSPMVHQAFSHRITPESQV